MGRAVLTNGDTRVSCADLYVEVGVCDRVTNLLECTACRKHCEGGCENGLAGGRDTCRNGHHIALCDTAVEKSFGELLLENTGLGCRRKVSVENDEIVLLAECRKRVTVGFSCCYLLCHFNYLLIKGLP